ncbi:TRAP transporter large permease [Salinisphaera aquimarina]|uniref:TRAP transporter large permease protein n=1 Tax=Salinisphaera aquimarina TaxID=2094031 RepID=A0ABV7EPU8_9GAMM
MTIVIALCLMLVLLAIGTHVAVVLGLVTAGLVLTVAGVPATVIAQTAFKSVNSYPMLAIPMFVLAGNLMMKGDLAKLMIDLIGSLVRSVRGGLAITVMLSSVFFAAVSGSSVGSAAAIGVATIDGLKKERYPTHFAAGIVAVGGTLGIMIPPSLSFILIGSIVGLPVDQLFVAGILPALLEATCLLCTVAYLSWKHQYGEIAAAPDFKGFGQRLPGAFAALMMPVLIIGSIYGGYLTPTEVSAFAAAYAAFLCVFVYRSVRAGDLWDAARNSLLQTTMIFAVVMGGSLVAFILARMGVSANLISLITSLDLAAWQFLLIVNVLLLVLGMFLDGVALVVLTAPLLFPLAKTVGVDPIHFAVIMVANSEIATITPPVGLNLFVMSGIAKTPVHEVARGVLPFYAIRLVALLIITFVPALSLALL